MKRGLDQAELATALGVAASLVSYWVNGQRRPSIDNAFALETLTKGLVPAKSWTRPPR